MKRLLALTLMIAATTPAAFAQPQTEPRLAGAAEQTCSDDAIRQALAGSYTGPPCRFTDMPAGLEAAPQRPQPQPAARQAVTSVHHEGNSFAATQQSTSFRTQTAGRQWPSQASDPTTSPAAYPPRDRDTHAGEPIRLSDDFFRGGLVGGVERPFVPLYSYRGVILIGADGQVRTGHAGLEHRVLQVRALDYRTAPVQQPLPRRAYPYP